MKRDAETHAAEDMKRKENIEARNTADSMAYQAEKALEELGDKVPQDVKNQVTTKASEVRKLLEDPNANTEAIKRATEDLTKVVQKIGEAVYQQPGGGVPGAEGFTPPPGGEQPDSGDEDVIDGNFKDA
jgi:molecular chaperone DnaK